MTWPATAPITVTVKTCCERLANEPCDCAEFAASWMAALETPIFLPPHAGFPPATDPALTEGEGS